eukprot:g12375.t1
MKMSESAARIHNASRAESFWRRNRNSSIPSRTRGIPSVAGATPSPTKLLSTSNSLNSLGIIDLPRTPPLEGDCAKFLQKYRMSRGRGRTFKVAEEHTLISTPTTTAASVGAATPSPSPGFSLSSSGALSASGVKSGSPSPKPSPAAGESGDEQLRSPVIGNDTLMPASLFNCTSNSKLILASPKEEQEASALELLVEGKRVKFFPQEVEQLRGEGQGAVDREFSLGKEDVDLTVRGQGLQKLLLVEKQRQRCSTFEPGTPATPTTPGCPDRVCASRIRQSSSEAVVTRSNPHVVFPKMKQLIQQKKKSSAPSGTLLPIPLFLDMMGKKGKLSRQKLEQIATRERKMQSLEKLYNWQGAGVHANFTWSSTSGGGGVGKKSGAYGAVPLNVAVRGS